MIPLQLGGLVADWRVSLERPSLGEGGGTPGNFIQLITNAGRGWGVIGSELLPLLGHGLGSGTPSEPLLHPDMSQPGDPGLPHGPASSSTAYEITTARLSP